MPKKKTAILRRVEAWWNTLLGMRGHERYLRFENLEIGSPILARCSMCSRVFTEKPKPGDKTNDLLLKMREDFKAHECKPQGESGTT